MDFRVPTSSTSCLGMITILPSRMNKFHVAALLIGFDKSVFSENFGCFAPAIAS